VYQAFSSEEISEAKGRVELLSQIQQTLDETWKSLRWTIDIITYARDKTVRGGLPLSVLYAPPPSPTESPTVTRRELDPASSSSDAASSAASDGGYHSDISVKDTGSPGHQGVPNTEETEELWIRASNQPGILRIYAAYDTGLTKGTSVKLHVTPRTTAREVINLVVQQLNKAVQNKGLEGPIYTDEELLDFCLVAVIGARERILRDEYQPLQLQNPWTKGRLYVRLKANLLAAIDHGQVTSV